MGLIFSLFFTEKKNVLGFNQFAVLLFFLLLRDFSVLAGISIDVLSRAEQGEFLEFIRFLARRLKFSRQTRNSVLVNIMLFGVERSCKHDDNS